jgi:hypothetical protein
MFRIPNSFSLHVYSDHVFVVLHTPELGRRGKRTRSAATRGVTNTHDPWHERLLHRNLACLWVNHREALFLLQRINT